MCHLEDTGLVGKRGWGNTEGMLQAWIAQKLINVKFYEFLGCPIYKYLR
jgi:hypothetical protein